MPASPDSPFTVTFRTPQHTYIQDVPFARLAEHVSQGLLPVRTPVSYHGQMHLPGLYWMSKMGELVSYESRLEMVILMHLDFDPQLQAVVPQPFTLAYHHREKCLHHTPDFLALRRDSPPEVIDVKPRKYVTKEKTRRAFTASENACTGIGWAYSVRSEPPVNRLVNLRWLSGFRRVPRFYHEYAEDLISASERAVSIALLLGGFDLQAVVRPVLFHLLWTQKIKFDIAQVLSDSSLVWRAA